MVSFHRRLPAGPCARVRRRPSVAAPRKPDSLAGPFPPALLPPAL